MVWYPVCWNLVSSAINILARRRYPIRPSCYRWLWFVSSNSNTTCRLSWSRSLVSCSTQWVCAQSSGILSGYHHANPLDDIEGLVNVILVIYISSAFKRLDQGILPQTSELRREYGGSMDVLRDPRASPAFDQEEKYKLDETLAIRVDLPIEPAGTYVAPDSWRTTSPGGRKY